jgi:secreted trypsin-like serine protease
VKVVSILQRLQPAGNFGRFSNLNIPRDPSMIPPIRLKIMRHALCHLLPLWLIIAAPSQAAEKAIMAGHENGAPPDVPSLRIDSLGAVSPFNFVGALQITSGAGSFIGSATALSPYWLLTAGHNVDITDNGQPDESISVNFHLPDIGIFAGLEYYTPPQFTGFGNSSIHHDLALIRLAEPLPDFLNFPMFHTGLEIGDVVTLAGFGRSGYGNYGYTTSASLSARRIGENTIDSLVPGESGQAEVFRYTFADPGTYGQPGGSLGNNVETIIGPGDSGGPILIFDADHYYLAGISTFTEGYGGRFGDIGGGIVLEPYHDWIFTTIPEPSTAALFMIACGLLFVFGKRRGS